MATMGIIDGASCRDYERRSPGLCYVRCLFGCCKVVRATRAAELLVIYCSFKLDFVFDNKLLITVPEDVPCLL